MGTTGAIGMAEAVQDGTITLTQALAWHLQCNHYPPVPTSMIDACIAAIDACNEQDWNAEIALPEGVFYKNNSTAPAAAIVEAHHLDAWLSEDEEF